MLIPTLAEWLHQWDGAQVRVDASDDQMIVDVHLPRRRKQRVKISCVPDRTGTFHLIFFQSRVCEATSAEIVSAALRANHSPSWAGFAMDTSTEPPMIDAVYSILANDVEFGEFVAALDRIATFADELETKINGGDRF